MQLIPLPRRLTVQDGLFLIDHNTAIVLDATLDDKDLATARLLQQEIKKVIAITLPIKKVLQGSEHAGRNCIFLAYDSTESNQEAYRLTVSTERIVISACANRGFLYGVATLIQLCKTEHAEIGGMSIDDEPSYANRGYMLDVTRGRVPAMRSLKEWVDRLALYKINQLQLYTENSFRFDGLEEIWSQTDPFTQEEMLELDRYCDMRGIELVPCIASFGHLYDLLRSDSFRKFSELDTEKGEPFTWYHRMRYHILNVSDPASFTLITGLIDQYLPLFRSKKINICCDETFDLGKAKSASMAEKLSYGEMYLHYVNRLVEYLQDKGKEVMIWADIVQNHPEHLDKLNAQVTCLNWYYYHGVKEETVKIFSDKNLKQYVCPSVSGYSRLVNAYDMSFTNIREMAQYGHKYQAEGFLNTDWGDSGHINMPMLSVPGMIYGAALSWNVEDDREIPLIDQIISLVEFNDRDKKLVGLLRELSRQDVIIFNCLAFFRDFKVYGLSYQDFNTCLYENAKNEIMQASEEQLTTAISQCKTIIKALKQNDIGSRTGQQQAIAEFYLAVRGVALMQELALVIKKFEYGQDLHLTATPHELAGKLEYWLVDYCEAWRAVSREGELFRIKEFVAQICSILRKYDAQSTSL